MTTKTTTTKKRVAGYHRKGTERAGAFVKFHYRNGGKVKPADVDGYTRKVRKAKR